LSCGTAGIPVKYHGDEETREREVGHPWLSIISSLEFGREREHGKKGRKKKKKCGVEQKKKERKTKKKFARETPWVISSRRFTPRAIEKKNTHVSYYVKSITYIDSAH
jgi:hypothetical protein